MGQLVGVVPVGVEQPAGYVASEHQKRAAGGADVSGGHIVSAARTRSAGRPVQRILEMARQVALGSKAAKFLKFFRREPSQNLSNIGHDGSLQQTA